MVDLLLNANPFQHIFGLHLNSPLIIFLFLNPNITIIADLIWVEICLFSSPQI